MKVMPANKAEVTALRVIVAHMFEAEVSNVEVIETPKIWQQKRVHIGDVFVNPDEPLRMVVNEIFEGLTLKTFLSHDQRPRWCYETRQPLELKDGERLLSEGWIWMRVKR